MTRGYGKRKAMCKMQTIKGKTLVTVNGDDGWIQFPSLKEALTFVDVLGDLLDIGQDNRIRLGAMGGVTSLIPKPPTVKRVIFTDSGEEVLA